VRAAQVAGADGASFSGVIVIADGEQPFVTAVGLFHTGRLARVSPTRTRGEREPR
jgi:hypothetical protein